MNDSIDPAASPAATALKQALTEHQGELLAAVAACRSTAQLEQLRVDGLGKKGKLTLLLRELGKVPAAVRPELGELANQIKLAFSAAISQQSESLRQIELAAQLEREAVDVTLPGRSTPAGGIHPVTRVIEEISGIFGSLGFAVATGPEVESDWHNFTALNIPPDHPAREMHDTFYLAPTPSGEKRVLRTHTSPVQVRVMREHQPPLRVIAPGRVFRCDSDITHTPMFHQVEGFMIERGVHFGELKGLLSTFLRAFFARELPVRFRPSFFPFTEPSAEVDMGCLFCNYQGCRVCKGTGWLEVLGCGMIHPVVLANGGIDATLHSGFAFGMGVERMAMLKYGIGDLRTFFDNDLRFLAQYGGGGV